MITIISVIFCCVTKKQKQKKTPAVSNSKQLASRSISKGQERETGVASGCSPDVGQGHGHLET